MGEWTEKYYIYFSAIKNEEICGNIEVVISSEISQTNISTI